MNNVMITKDLDLCVSCGICKAVCPANAIDLKFSKGQYLPFISDQCNDCGLCLKVCPGYKVNFNELYRAENRDLPENIYEGQVIESYVCHTKNKHIREKSASGGMITSLIVELISKGHYSGAYVLSFKEPSNDLAKLTYTDSMEQIISASKSKYLPASVEKVVLTLEQKNSSIVVGTPCQIHGVKKYCILNNINTSKILFLGLFCEKTLNYNFLDYYEWQYGKGRNIISFDYRNKEKDGWPGHTKLIFMDGTVAFVDRIERMKLKKYFQLKRCLFCIDKLNQMADISFGDCYIKGEATDLGKSNIIVRTEKGSRALESVKESVILNKVDSSLIFKSQNISQKEENLSFCTFINSRTGHVIYPEIHLNTFSESALKLCAKKYENAVKVIELGYAPSNFAKIRTLIKRENYISLIRKAIAICYKVFRKMGFLK